MTTCKECRYWKKDKQLFGTCNTISYFGFISELPSNVTTRSGFGCIHGKKREDEISEIEEENAS